MNQIVNHSEQLAKLGERQISATQRYVITLSDEEFHKLKKRKNHLKETLIGRHGDIELIIQREAKR